MSAGGRAARWVTCCTETLLGEMETMRKLTLIAVAVAATAMLAACSSSGSGSSLTGKDWHLTAITEKTPAFQGVVPTAEQANYTINFAASGGTFSAKADCNQVAGTYTTSGSDGITITPDPRRWRSAARGRWATCTSTR